MSCSEFIAVDVSLSAAALVIFGSDVSRSFGSCWALTNSPYSVQYVLAQFNVLDGTRVDCDLGIDLLLPQPPRQTRSAQANATPSERTTTETPRSHHESPEQYAFGRLVEQELRGR
ncbi:hypothetical protein ACWEIJ_33100 [Lentzea sp. NPDC004789]